MSKDNHKGLSPEQEELIRAIAREEVKNTLKDMIAALEKEEKSQERYLQRYRDVGLV